MAITVGLDIGGTGIRAVALDSGKAPPTLRRVGTIPLEPGAVVAGEIIDEGAVTIAVSRLWKQHRLPKQRVVVGIGNQRVIVRQADVPRMTEDELREALPFQVQEYIPIPVEETILDFVPLEEFTTGSGEAMLSILAVAAQREMVQSFLRAVKGAGIVPIAIDLHGFALVRALLSGSFDLAGPQAIIDIGASLTHVVLVRAGLPRFLRIIPKGGDAFTSAIATEMNLGFDEADQLKRSIGVVPEGPAPQAGDEEDQTKALLTKVADVFIEEIRSSVNYYLSQAGDEGLSRLIVAGNSARLPHLATRIGHALDARVEPARVLESLDVGKVDQTELSGQLPVLPAAVGLALWGT